MKKKTKARWIKWGKGLISAGIGGFSTGVTVAFVDPASFNIDTGLSNLLKVCVVAGVVAMFNYLKQSPLPAAPEVK
ncbi:MAG TPA: hypothetical protein ENH62_14865 [Marinobacter sp.]|uniref:Holin n=1 Tax=marine sediment metagenome TaxID=412755 RepID=A0A0F9RH71_9ZZZZ|nr:hypothetical protein [Marinobacter sp.]